MKRLGSLKAYDMAWRQLKWSDNTHLPDIVEGLPRWTPSDSLVMYAKDHRHGTHLILHIPSKLREVHDAQQYFTLTSDLIYFSMVPSQDLVIALSNLGMILYRIRSLSSANEAHPLAQNTGIIPVEGHGLQFLDVFGDYLLDHTSITLATGVSFSQSVRNWKTGVTELTEARPSHGSYHRFIDDKHFIYVVNAQSAIGSDPRDPTCLRVVPFPNRNNSSTHTSYSFVLPDFMQEHLSVLSCTISGHPPDPRSTACFHNDPADGLLYLHTTVLAGDHQSEFDIDIPVRTLTTYLRAHPPGVVPWDAWGPAGTRVTQMPTRPRTKGRFVSGMRRVVWPALGDSEPRVTVLDYHPRRVARARVQKKDGDGWAVMDGASVSGLATGSHIGGLETWLPCIATEMPLPAALAASGVHYGIWMCDDGIVFIEYDPLSEPQTVLNTWVYTI
ncbi:hypothetical protein BV25DRAFT_1915773 [Artomyces pyxidatus]|uniref:Uncharacterized protein n=1 Tax=Artomyces pyxidatus TaxID=48021 RepID=A0ACB8T297_9AGAM|nr:hypothetical protein BV25DRAFT_1915773 [Artomyces pyxidatus]